MFKRTRNRLVIFNAVVFFILLNILGGIMYLSTDKRLYYSIDQNLHHESENFNDKRLADLLGDQDNRLDRTMNIIFYNNDGLVVVQQPHNQFNASEIAQFNNVIGQQGIIALNVGQRNYRVINKSIGVGIIQFIYNTESEKKALDNLLYIIIIVDLASIIISLFVGFLLANHALIPIKKAWDKQQQFISDASHELRTPLTVLKVQLERLFRHPTHTVEDESQKISVMIDETQRMSKLVTDLLTLARTDSNQIEILEEPVNLKDLLSKLEQEFYDLALLNEVQMEFTIEKPIIIQGDRERLHQLFVILIDNAFKYLDSHRQKKLEIKCHQSGRFAYVTVTDTGIGISEADLQYIFDRFYRVDKSRTRSEGGTGLGLSIAKWIVEAHRGTITVSSELNVGTMFTIYFPID